MIHTGDCVEVMRTFDDASVDAVVTDPPYGLEFMGKEWDRNLNHGPWATEAFRVLKPGGYLLAFGGTRTVHRLASAIEDAGFEIRDELVWIYASGFPKSLNLDGDRQGWGTALKPAHEPIVMARKPLVGTVVQNVTRYGTGAINIDGSRIPGQWTTWRRNDGTINPRAGFANEYVGGDERPEDVRNPESPAGRWPSNVLLSDPELFDQPNPGVVGSGATAGDNGGGFYVQPEQDQFQGASFGDFLNDAGKRPFHYGDSGGYSRFFLLSTRDNGSCASCGRALSAEQTSYRLSPSAASAPSDAPTSPAGTPDSTVNESPTPTPSGSGSTTPETETRFWHDGIGTTMQRQRSRRRESRPDATPPSKSAKSPDATSPATVTTTTTPARLMCATCAEAITSPTTSDSRELRDYPVAFIIPKADRAEREPVLRGQLEPKDVGERNQYAGLPDKRMDHIQNRTPRENSHPTVKPVDLMRHLVRLVTPPGGTVLDPFLGSGTTAIACELEGFPWIGIEREPEYVAIAEARLNGTQRGLGLDVPAPTERDAA